MTKNTNLVKPRVVRKYLGNGEGARDGQGISIFFGIDKWEEKAKKLQQRRWKYINERL